jgi:type I restriction enzyme S subunit
MNMDPKERLLQDSKNWPNNGLPFEQIARRNPIPYDQMRDAIFALLSGPDPALRQVFDREAKCIHLQRTET